MFGLDNTFDASIAIMFLTAVFLNVDAMIFKYSNLLVYPDSLIIKNWTE